MALRSKPIATEQYAVDSFVPDAGSAYIFGTTSEDRSAHSAAWEAATQDVKFIRISAETPSDFTAEINNAGFMYSLRSKDKLQKFFADIDRDTCYLDITGLPHHVWAPLVRTGLALKKNLIGIYVEPLDYKHSPTPTEGEIFDLSESIRGISPIPGFVSLADSEDEDTCFVPLLGFEGTRFSYLLEQVQPPGGKIVPIIGVPGFRAEYPFYTYQGNKLALLETKAWRNVKYAPANCPFSLFYTLQEIAQEHPGDSLKIAPIGTKPHALGAVLYAISSPSPVELVYDHPIRKSKRTTGTAQLLVYYLSTLPIASRTTT